MNIRYTPGLENPIQVGVNECLSFNMTMEEARSLQQNLAEIIKSAEKKHELTKFEKAFDRIAVKYINTEITDKNEVAICRKYANMMLDAARKELWNGNHPK